MHHEAAEMMAVLKVIGAILFSVVWLTALEVSFFWVLLYASWYALVVLFNGGRVTRPWRIRTRKFAFGLPVWF